MVDWLVIWGVTQAVGFAFRPILEDLAKDAAKDWAKDILKGIPNKILDKLKKEDIDIAAGKALKEFLQLMQQQLKVRCKLLEDEIQEYTQDIQKFISVQSVAATLGEAFDISCEDLNSKTLEDCWRNLELKPLPLRVNWQLLTDQYFTQVQELLLESKELHSILELQKLSSIDSNTQEIAGIIADFNLVKYQESIRERYGNLKLDSLDTTGYAYNDLKLWRMFVAQDVREVHQVLLQVYELPKEHLRRLRETEQLEAEIQTEELEKHKRFYLEQPICSVLDIVNDRQTYKYIVILGDPGSGKSTLLQFLALNWAESPLDNVIVQPIPLLIELRTYMRRREEKECHNFLEFFHKCSGAITHLNQHQLHEQLKAGNAIVMFDGLDEVFDLGHREDVITDIHRFTNDYPNVQVIVTSRVIGYKQQRLRDAEFRHFMLQDLDSEQIQDFIHRWHELTFNDEADKVRKRERLKRGIEVSTAISELAGNPLLLTMMAILNRNQELPRDRATLYNQASRVLLHQWDVERALVEDKRLDHKTIDYKDKQAMLRQVAYYMHTSDKGLAGNLISVDDLEKIITDYLKTLEVTPAREVARVMINQLRTRNFMLCFLGADYYAFVHRSFLEYFCAEEFVQRFGKRGTDNGLSIEHLKTEVFGKHWHDETWHEVLRLITGMIDAEFVGEILEYLIVQDGEAQKYVNLFLAAKCFSEVRNPLVIKAKADRLLKQVKDLIQYDLPYYYDSFDEINLVREINTQAVTAVAAIWKENPGTKTFLRDRAIADDSKDVRGAAIIALANNFSQDPDTKIILQNCAITDNSKDVRSAAIEVLASTFPQDPDTKIILQDRATADHDWNVRSAAITVLASTFPQELNTKTFLRNCATTDNSGYVRSTVITVLASIFSQDPNVKTLLQDRATSDHDWDVRRAAIIALARNFSQDPNVRIFIQERTIVDHDSDVRRAAITVLASTFPQEPNVNTFLQDRATADHSGDVRSAAIVALARYFPQDPNTKIILRDRATADYSGDVRSAAIEALARHFPQDPDTKTLLQDRATADDSGYVQSSTAIEALASIFPQDPDTKSILQNRATADNSGYVRRTAIQALASTFPQDPDTKSILQNRATTDNSGYVRHTAITVLVCNFPQDPDTKIILKDRATADSYKDVRSAAIQALGKHFQYQPDLFEIYYNCAVHDPCQPNNIIFLFEPPNPRRIALEIIIKQFPHYPQTLRLLRDRTENDPDEQVREYAQKKLKQWQG